MTIQYLKVWSHKITDKFKENEWNEYAEERTQKLNL